MNKIMTMAGSVFLAFAATGCVSAEQLPMRAIPITVHVYVHDSDGKPVEGAQVHLFLPRYRLGDQNQVADAFTNADGVAVATGTAQQDYQVGADKPGYYHTAGPHRSIDTDTSFKQFAAGDQQVELELRQIRNPIVGITKEVRAKLPTLDKPVGFDLEVGDWVTPYGTGSTADLVFKVGGYFKNLHDYDQSLVLTFSNSGDGIILLKLPARGGPVFKFPYEAPSEGYESQRIWTKTFNGKTESTTIDGSGETNYILRIRSTFDEKGNVSRAMYAVIDGEVVLGGNNEIGRNVSFTYRLNPDWARNIEFSPEKRQKTTK